MNLPGEANLEFIKLHQEYNRYFSQSRVSIILFLLCENFLQGQKAEVRKSRVQKSEEQKCRVQVANLNPLRSRKCTSQKSKTQKTEVKKYYRREVLFNLWTIALLIF